MGAPPAQPQTVQDWIAHAEDLHRRGARVIDEMTMDMSIADARLCREFADTMFAAARSAAAVAVAIRAAQS